MNFEAKSVKNKGRLESTEVIVANVITSSAVVALLVVTFTTVRNNNL